MSSDQKTVRENQYKEAIKLSDQAVYYVLRNFLGSSLGSTELDIVSYQVLDAAREQIEKTDTVPSFSFFRHVAKLRMIDMLRKYHHQQRISDYQLQDGEIGFTNPETERQDILDFYTIFRKKILALDEENGSLLSTYYKYRKNDFLSSDQIAEMLGLTPYGLRRRLSRARERIYEELKKDTRLASFLEDPLFASSKLRKGFHKAISDIASERGQNV